MKQKNNDSQKEIQEVLEKISRFLSLRPRSEKEIANYLKRKKIPSKVSSKILKILKKEKLIDDKYFASWWIEQRINFRPKGKIALIKELKIKGVSPEIINQAVSKLNEVELAKKLLLKKKSKFKNLPPPKFLQKVFMLLSTYGFRRETIRKIIEDLKVAENFKSDKI